MERFNPEDFIREFDPGDNPFEVSIVRLMNPRAMDPRAMDKPILMKLITRLKMRAFTPEHKQAFDYLIKAIEIREMFCGIFTPEVSEVFYDKDVMLVDLTSYIKPGMEIKLANLQRVAKESPKIHVERIPKKELMDRAITRLFLQNVIYGSALGEALALAMQPEHINEEIERIENEYTEMKEGAKAPVVSQPGAEPEDKVEVAPEPVNDAPSLIDKKMKKMEQLAITKKKKKKVKKKKKKKEEAPKGDVVTEEVSRPSEPEPVEPRVDTVATEQDEGAGLGSLLSRLKSLNINNNEKGTPPSTETTAEPTVKEQDEQDAEVPEDGGAPEGDRPVQEDGPSDEETLAAPEGETSQQTVDGTKDADDDDTVGEVAEAEAGASSLELIMQRLRHGHSSGANEQDGAAQRPKTPSEPPKEALNDSVADGTIDGNGMDPDGPILENPEKPKKKRKKAKKGKKNK